MKSLLLVIALLSYISEAAKILVLTPLSLPSHQRFCEPIYKELASRGHQITLLTSIVSDKFPANSKQIVLPGLSLKDALTLTTAENDDLDPSSKFFTLRYHLWNATLLMTERALNSTDFTNFVKSPSEKFDLILYDVFHSEAFLMFAYKYDAPIIGISPTGYSPLIDNILGNSLELSYVRNPLLDMSTRGGFVERLKNTFWTTFESLERKRSYLSSQQKLAEKYFQDLKTPLPSLADIEKRVSLVLVDSHFSIGEVRTAVPGLVEVGGVHLKNLPKLPNNVTEFIAGSQNGVIYLGISEDVLSDKVFGKHAKLFIKSFSQMKLGFVFETEEGEVRDKHENIFYTKPLPSVEVLGNSKVKLIITEGSQPHLHDAIAQGVPLLIIPSFGYQLALAQKVTDMKIGEILYPDQLSIDNIRNYIERVVNNREYADNVGKLSKIYKDRPMNALDKAIYWIEYVMRYEGASHMNSPAKDLTWIQYNLVDVISFLTLCAVLLFLIIKWLWFNLALRKRLPRTEELNRLIEKEKLKTK